MVFQKKYIRDYWTQIYFKAHPPQHDINAWKSPKFELKTYQSLQDYDRTSQVNQRVIECRFHEWIVSLGSGLGLILTIELLSFQAVWCRYIESRQRDQQSLLRTLIAYLVKSTRPCAPSSSPTRTISSTIFPPAPNPTNTPPVPGMAHNVLQNPSHIATLSNSGHHVARLSPIHCTDRNLCVSASLPKTIIALDLGLSLLTKSEDRFNHPHIEGKGQPIASHGNGLLDRILRISRNIACRNARELGRGRRTCVRGWRNTPDNLPDLVGTTLAEPLVVPISQDLSGEQTKVVVRWGESMAWMLESELLGVVGLTRK